MTKEIPADALSGVQGTGRTGREVGERTLIEQGQQFDYIRTGSRNGSDGVRRAADVFSIASQLASEPPVDLKALHATVGPEDRPSIRRALQCGTVERKEIDWRSPRT